MASAKFDTALAELEAAYSRSSSDKSQLERCLDLIERIKELLAKMNMETHNTSKEHLLKMRNFLELSAAVFLDKNDTAAFKCVYTQLHPFYFDFVDVLGKSPKMNTMLSMWMLHLLSENKIGELYMLLERIPEELKRDEKVAFVINMERLMTEGNLGKLLDLDDNNVEYFKIIASTARNKIASSIELSYRELTMDDLLHMLKFKNKHELSDFITYFNQDKLQLDPDAATWKVLEDSVVFQNGGSSKHKIPSKELLTNSLEYLNDLEKIV